MYERYSRKTVAFLSLLKKGVKCVKNLVSFQEVNWICIVFVFTFVSFV